jgi:hypothetical protein
MKSILDPSFRYTSSVQTDVRKTFARIRRELREREQSKSTYNADGKLTVLAMHRRQAEGETSGAIGNTSSSVGAK